MTGAVLDRAPVNPATRHCIAGAPFQQAPIERDKEQGATGSYKIIFGKVHILCEPGAIKMACLIQVCKTGTHKDYLAVIIWP